MKNSRILNSKRLNFGSVVLAVSVIVIIAHAAVTTHAATAGNVTVNFNTVTQSLAPYAFSGSLSTFGSDGGSIAASAKQRAALTSLGLGMYRIPLQYNGGTIISSAGGGPKDISGDTWVTRVKGLGAQPMIVLGGTSDNNFTPADAANMVRHFNTGGGSRVDYWVVGNEPNNGGMSIENYCTLFNNAATAMKAVDSTIKIAGPAWSYYDSGKLQTFLNCAGSVVDIIDYHHYGMGSGFLDNATALAQTANYETEVRNTRQMINATIPARTSQISIQVGEFNWSWQKGDGYQGYQGFDDRFYQPVATVWAASAAGHIAAGGARAHQYSDQNGPLGITFEYNTDATHYGRTVDDPMPIYFGLRMFSGGDKFRGFGSTMVAATTTLPNVEAFASTNAQSIVLINKDPAATRTATIDLTGAVSGTADIWQTNQAAPFAEPVKQATVAISSQLSVVLLPYSVTTIVLNAGSVTPTSTATATTTATASPSTLGDLNADAKVNVFDLSIMLSRWGTTGANTADLNHDATVNIFDLSILLSHWLP